MRIFSRLCCVRNAHLHYDDTSTDAAADPAKTGSRKSASKPEPYSEDRARKLFKTYEDADTPGEISPEGFEKLCGDLDISLEGALPLVLAWQMHSTEMAKFKESEWIQGTAELRCVYLQTDLHLWKHEASPFVGTGISLGVLSMAMQRFRPLHIVACAS